MRSIGRSWRWRVGFVLVALLVVSAGSDPTGASAATRAATVGLGVRQATPAPADASTPVPTGTTASPIRRRELPPGSASTFLYFGSGAGPPGCTLKVGGAVEDAFGKTGCALEIASSTALTFLGFDDTQSISLEIAVPDGTIRQETVPPREGSDRGPTLGWFSPPGTPVGEYRLRARQGALDEQFVVSLALANGATAVVQPREGPPGTTFTILLAGYAPGSTVPVHLYRYVGYAGGGLPTFAYNTTLTNAVVNARGEATLQFGTAPEDPVGEYAIHTDPPVLYPGPRTYTQFVLAPPRPDPNAWWTWDNDALLVDLAQSTIEQANRVWASVVAKDGAPVSSLSCVYADRWLDEVRTSVERMRGRGQYREATMTGPVRIQQVRKLEEPVTADLWGGLGAVVQETWADRLFGADGALVATLPATVRQRYVITWHPRATESDCDILWKISESEVLR